MFNGLDVGVSPMDDDAYHLQVHQEGARVTGDPQGHYRKHIMLHMAQAQAKAAAAAPPPPQGQPGMPGMGAPGVAGTPRPGAVPAGPRGPQQPPGAVRPDNMQDATAGGRG